MRIWLVPPKVLDDKRLLAAHREVHMAFGLLKKSNKTGKVNNLICRWYSPSGLVSLSRYHSNLVFEMEHRGWKGHNTDIDIISWPKDLRAMLFAGYDELDDSKEACSWPPPWITQEEIDKDISDLRERWAREGKKARV